MPGWYLIISGAIAVAVLAGIAYRALTDERRGEAYTGVEDLDPAYTDAPTRREAEGVREPLGRTEEPVGRAR